MNQIHFKRLVAAATLCLAGPAMAATATLFGTQAEFLAALGATPTQTQTFDGFAAGSNLTGVQVLPGVTMSTNLSSLTAFASGAPGNNVAFALDRNQPEAIYDVNLGAGYTAFGFEITNFDPATPGPGFLSFYFADGDTTYTLIPVLPLNPTESTPLFFGVQSDVAIVGMRWSEGPEIGGIQCCEETGLDNFIVASPVPEPGKGLMLFSGLAGLVWIYRKRMPLA